MLTRSLLTIAIVLSFIPAVHAQEVFKAGYAQRDITPPEGLPMWGYGARHDLPATGTMDPLYAKVVVIEVGEEKLAIMGLDLGRSPTFAQMDKIREGVKKTGVNHLLLSGSHTHHGPVLELLDKPGYGQGKFDNALAWYDVLVQNLIDAINEAAGKAVPAKIGWGSEEVPYNRNRQAKGDIRPRDPELSVVRFDTLEGEPIALVVNFAAHPVWIDIQDRRWSSEWPGQMSKHVEEKTGAPTIFMQGAAGDMSPNGEGADDYIALGKKIGDSVVAINSKIETKTPEKPSIIAKPEEKFEFETRVDLQNPLLLNTFKQMFFPEILAMMEELPNNTISPRLNTLLINGELALVGGSGEFFAEHAVRLKKDSPAKKTIFFGYCNGHQMYFPSKRAIAEGGYGADPAVSWVPPGAGEQIIDKALVNVGELVAQAQP